MVVAEVVEEPSTSGYAKRGRTRAGFLELLRMIDAREIDCVVAYKSDRLSRGGGPGWAPLLEAFEGAGRSSDRAVATPDGWLSEFEIGIRATMDREESKKTSDRMRSVRAAEARAGKPRPSGRRPFGYSLDWAKVRQKEAKLIREAADRILAGESTWSIALDWNRRKVSTVTGGDWTVGVLRNVLVSGRIAGLREHRGEVVAPGTWPAIIDRDTHERLRSALAPRRRPAGQQPRRHPLVGILRCWKCGGPLRSMSGGQRRPRAYACRKLPGLEGCGGTRIPADPVETHLRRIVCGTLADPVTRKALLAFLPDPSQAHQAGVVSELRAVEGRRERLIDLYLDGGLEKPEYLRRLRELEEELARLEHAVTSAGQSTVLAGLPRTVKGLEAEWDERGPQFQRALLKAVLEPVIVGPGRSGRGSDPIARLDIRPIA